jgi:hypothetical protein
MINAVPEPQLTYLSWASPEDRLSTSAQAKLNGASV